MAVLAIDLGGTKLAIALFHETGEMACKEVTPLNGKQGAQVGLLITSRIAEYLTEKKEYNIQAIGVSVPGISRRKSGTVWAPNIPGWDDYPLLGEIKQVAGNMPVTIDSDRACYILGECWQGAAKGCNNAIYLAVGTGIGAGILIDGSILRGAHDIAGAIGWMALNRPFKEKYIPCGCFEHHASGEGIAKVARELLQERNDYMGELKAIPTDHLTATAIFTAYGKKDPIAIQVMQQCIEFWGMAAANLVSLFNPEKIIIGGGVFGPGVQFIKAIKEEATKWAQPIAITQVSFETSALGGDAGVYGAGFLAKQHNHH